MDQPINLTAKIEAFVNGRVISKGALDRNVTDKGSAASNLFLTLQWQAVSRSMRSWESVRSKRMLELGADSQDRMDQPINLTAKIEAFVNGRVISKGALDRNVTDKGSAASNLFLTSPWQTASWSMRPWESVRLERMSELGADSQDRMDQIVNLPATGEDQVSAGDIMSGLSI